MAFDLTSLRLSPVMRRALLFGALALGLGWLLRYQVIEPRSIGQMCGGVGTPWWCPLRTGLIKAHEWYVYGGAALACAGAAWWRDDARWAIAGVACAAVGLVAYNTELAAAGLLLALLKLLRA
jgi:hypothetical protein